jgi:hypothetical protein
VFRWLLEKLAVEPHFNEDPYFRVQVHEEADSDLVRVTVNLIGSRAVWRGKFKVEPRAGFPLETQVPDLLRRDGEFFLIEDKLTGAHGVSVEFDARPLQTGSGRIEFWFERDVGLGGQIAIQGALFGQGDQDAIRKNREYAAKHWARWLDDNPEWSDADPK